MSKYTINVSFQTRVNKTTRTLQIVVKSGRFTTIWSWK